MREIKFRQPLMSKGKFQSWHYWGFISKGNFSSPTNEWVSGEPSLQFTGLLDKSGKEIYEGDIVKLQYQCVDDDGRVEEENYEKVIEIKYKVNMNDQVCGFSFFPCRGNDYIEVIGNIYENPELINNQKEELK